jgi:hypothetical protein
VPQVKDGAGGVTIHGTPGQFSNAAFFQRTLISSRLKEAFRLVSKFSFSINLLFTGISSLGVICEKHTKGSIIKNKILIIAL